MNLLELEIPAEYRWLYEQTDDGIVKYPDTVLRKRARPVSRITPDLHALIDHMLVTMHRAKGIGLAAPQVGVSLRLILIEAPDQPVRVIINPQILERSSEQVVGMEGCLSLPGLYGDVKRPEAIVLRGLNKHGKPIQLQLKGIEARIAQHEVDHLDGILFIDRVIPETLHWDVPDEGEQDEL
jgi:peptide deformylase